MKQIVKYLKKNNQDIGFVPTMGSLHAGHLALVKEAKKESDSIILSIFVNPLQFGENEDFDSYPRDEQKDFKLADEQGVDYVFVPFVEEMYPNALGITMSINKRIGVLCDRSRPGHFQGVLIVLSKLFHIIQPDFTYFGMKDAQQIAIVDLLIDELNFPIQLRMVPTVREENGLAKSSRNIRLSSVEKEEAPFLYQALKHGEKLIIEGQRSTNKLISELTLFLQNNLSGKIDYVEVLTFPDLEEKTQIESRVIIGLAVQFEKVRLIDNLIIDLNEIEKRRDDVSNNA